jgi:hypothetical protein
LYFLLVGPLIKLWLSTLIGILIIVIIKFFITKVIKILNFNYIFILGISSKCLKVLIEFYIINFIILKLINVI